jgi:outer membrane receptor protein involved in Fe transport
VNSQDVLVGRAPGVTVMESSGQPGSGGTIKVRGINTVSQSMQPLNYVDGVRIVNDVHSVGGNGGRTATNPLQDINVDDIDHVEVIKGAAATTLYGTEASGGVLQIFTKRGTTGAPVWNFEASAGATVAPRLGINDPTQFFMACGDTSVMYGINQARTAVYPDTTYVLGDRIYFVDPTCPASGRWQKTGPSASTALSVRGGNERVTYYLSGNYNNADGYLQTGHSKEGGFRGNFSFAPLTSLKFTLNTAYQRRDTRWVPDGNNAAGFLLNVGRGWAGNFKYGKRDDCADTPKGKLCQTNAYIFETEALSRSDHFTSGLTIEYDPTENLVNRFAVGWDYSDMSDNVVRPFGHLYTPAGSFAKGDTRLTKLSLDYAGSLNSRFGDNVSSSFSWGGQLFRDGYFRTDLATANFAGPGDPTLNTGAITAVGDRRFAGTNAGFLVQELMGFNDRLFVTAGLRVDGNSSFGSNFGLQPYPKLSLSWVLSDYGFFPKSAAFETFKLRGAIGQAGKAPGAFDKLRTWEPVAGDGGASGFAPANIGNPNVGPERTTETELGFDAGFLSGHLGIEFTAFRAKTVDALVPVDQPASLGNWNSLIDNVGDLQNEGLEASVNLGVITSRDVDWRLRASGSLLRSKVLNLGPLSVENPLAHMIAVGNNAYMKVGGPAPAYYAQYQLDNPNEYADPVILTDSLVEIGPVFPTKLLSLGTTLSLMDRVTLDGLWEFQGGMYAQNYTGQQSARRGAWWACLPFQEAYLKGGDVSGYTAFERARCAPNQRNLVVPNALDWYDIAWWTEKADFWKLRSISLSYRLPERLLPAGKSGTITIAGRNLFTLTDYTGTDPESNDAQDLYGTGSDRGAFGRRDYYQIPPGRTMVVSLRLTF